MDCPICLNHIDVQNEAFLNPCFHRYCFSCIQQWTESQKRHPSGQALGTEFACPLCKRRYTHVVYDCIGRSYRLLSVSGQEEGIQAMPLTADQRRRRALYMTHHPPCNGEQSANQAPASTKKPLPKPPTHPEVALFITRELQAVLLEDQVEIITQHVIGMLSILANRQKQSRLKGADVSPMYGGRQDFLKSISHAVNGFLEEHADRFAVQLWSFLSSGLTVAAYDSLIFGEHEQHEVEAGPAPEPEIED